MLISIALATFNGERYLTEQLDSLAAQDHLPAELVICDDQSTDGTAALVAAFAQTAPFPVRFKVNAERLGYRRNFMKAAELCSSALIAFSDQDDVWRADKLSQVVRRFADPAVLLVHHNARLVDGDGKPFGRLRELDGTADTIAGRMGASPWMFPQGLTICFRRELLALSELRERSIDFFDERDPLAHDQWLYLMGLVFGSTCYINDTLLDYRQHGSNAYGVLRPDKTRLDRLREKFDKFVDYRRYAASSERLASLLSEAKGEPTAIAATLFDQLADLYRRRGQVHAAQSVAARYRAWTQLRRSGGYAPRQHWSFDPNEAMRDLVIGVAMARLRRRTGRDPSRDRSLRVNPEARSANHGG
ncbi:glycosyltransferase family 2 protein [Glacieibacterium sp.]|uniref:glycosyltransferase family 2 protein n=1 Tax=Glacieibacterium sp. TaxID=2860237 RepID=UPI003AFFF7AC